jgi:hypothetical protein
MKRAISPSDLRPQPSAKFAAIEADERRIGLVKPNRSSFGKVVCVPVDREGQLVGLPPDLQVPVIPRIPSSCRTDQSS